MKQIIFTYDPEDFKNEIATKIIKELAISTNYLKGKEPSKLLTRKETAAYLNIALSTLWKYTKSGELKAYYIGNKVYYKENEVMTGLKTIR